MLERTDALLAGTTVDLGLQMQAAVVVRFAPGGVSRAEQRDDWNVKRCREMSRATVSRHQQVGVADGGFRQADRKSLIGQTEDRRMSSQAHDLTSLFAFRRA